jgi:glutamine amidotransferase
VKEEIMCRWLAYSGSPLRLYDILYRTSNSLLVQSKHSKLGVEPTNGDGFGVGWYADGDHPGVYRSVDPMWNDRNMREVAGVVSSHHVFAHIRAATGTPVEQSNCHPFKHGHWLFMHNGVIAGFRKLKRDLAIAVSPDLYPDIEGSTDSELFFYLTLTFGLTHDPPKAIARAVGLVEEVGRKHGVERPMQMTVATTDGKTTWAVRYSTERNSRSLFHSTDKATLRAQYPNNAVIQALANDTRLIVSEPLGHLEGAWQEVPESTCVVVRGARLDMQPFEPMMH